jgi:hypothetical protein
VFIQRKADLKNISTFPKPFRKIKSIYLSKITLWNVRGCMVSVTKSKNYYNPCSGMMEESSWNRSISAWPILWSYGETEIKDENSNQNNCKLVLNFLISVIMSLHSSVVHVTLFSESKCLSQYFWKYSAGSKLN